MTNPSFAVNVPLGGVSFGQVSIAILREIHKRGLSPSVFPIMGSVDLSSQRPDPAFQQWLEGCINSAHQRHSRKNAAIKLWHLQGSMDSVSDQSNHLITFHELDSITPSELNVLRNQRKVFVTNRFSQGIFAQFGVVSEYLPLGFDSFNFHQLPVRPSISGALSFGLFGKLEKRKGSLQVLAAWAKKYGNKKEYRLNAYITNPFMSADHQNQMIARALGGKQYFNITFHPWVPENGSYNTALQSSEIVISCSGGEGRDLPCFQATALGAWPIALRAHAYLDYLTDDNAILINPNGKAPAADGIFFHPNGLFNGGNIFTWSDDDFHLACDEAERRAKAGLNLKGMELQKASYSETVDVLLKSVLG